MQLRGGKNQLGKCQGTDVEPHPFIGFVVEQTCQMEGRGLIVFGRFVSQESIFVLPDLTLSGAKVLEIDMPRSRNHRRAGRNNLWSILLEEHVESSRFEKGQVVKITYEQSGTLGVEFSRLLSTYVRSAIAHAVITHINKYNISFRRLRSPKEGPYSVFNVIHEGSIWTEALREFVWASVCLFDIQGRRIEPNADDLHRIERLLSTMKQDPSQWVLGFAPKNFRPESFDVCRLFILLHEIAHSNDDHAGSSPEEEFRAGRIAWEWMRDGYQYEAEAGRTVKVDVYALCLAILLAFLEAIAPSQGGRRCHAAPLKRFLRIVASEGLHNDHPAYALMGVMIVLIRRIHGDLDMLTVDESSFAEFVLDLYP